jgi:hypothetical protein
MNASENATNEPVSHVNQIRDVIDRLKSQAKEKYKKDIALAASNSEEDISYDTSYLRGYYFGQVAALEDCYHLMVTLSDGLRTASSSERKMLLQQFTASISIIQMLLGGLQDPECIASAKEYLTSITDELEKLNV